MREHKFRGKRTDNGEWVFGAYMPATKQHDTTIGVYQEWSEYQPGWWEWYEVDPETVGECTFLSDKNGTDIYEGDIVIYSDMMSKHTYMVKHDRYQFEFFDGKYGNGLLSIIHQQCEVIDNIYDNPELLRGE